MPDLPRLQVITRRVGNKYAIGGICKYTTQCIENIINGRDWKVSKESLCHIVATTYEKTPENDKILRMLMARIVFKYLEGLVHDTEFLDTVGHIEGFNAMLVNCVVLKNKVLEARTYLVGLNAHALATPNHLSNRLRDCPSETRSVP